MGRLSFLIQRYRIFLCRLKGYSNIHKSVVLESNLFLDKVYPKGVNIGENTLVASHVIILTHEHVKRDKGDTSNPLITNTYIGRNCFIGVRSIILPGVTIGDEVVIGAHTVVSRDVPSNCIAVGNPCRIIKSGIKMDNKAILK
jgi:acetyltransferase-like isoleucine patch superfamily enzyme